MAGNRGQFVLWTPDEQGEDYQVIEEDDIIEEQGDISPSENYQSVQSEEDGENENQHYYIGDNLIEVPQETFIYLTEDGSVIASDTASSSVHSNVGVGMSHLIEQRVEEAENKIIGDQDEEEYTETIEEVINEEDWVETQDDIVTVGNEQIVATDNLVDEMETVPLPLHQDEYTTSRPYPCDFCSRRFRKKANLMNHMVSHQNDRPHTCQICKAQFIRRHDLMNHLKFHAYAPEDEEHAVEFRGGVSMDDSHFDGEFIFTDL